jgi:hypothetical protein
VGVNIGAGKIYTWFYEKPVSHFLSFERTGLSGYRSLRKQFFQSRFRGRLPKPVFIFPVLGKLVSKIPGFNQVE